MTATATEPTGPAPAFEEGTEPTGQHPTSAVAPALAAAPAPAPAPVLAPYLGLVASVLCALGGAWLLLAPYALDFRRGAAKLPRAAAVDLETGAAIVAVALLSAILFAAALFSRLRPRADVIELEMDAAEPETESESQPETQPDTEGQPQPDPEPPGASAASNSSSALREMLTPLVAALAADLRSQDPGGQPHQQRGDQRLRQEP